MNFKHLIFFLLYPISAVVQKRRPPPFETAGHYFKNLYVNKSTTNDSQITYQIKAIPAECASGFPLLELGFMEVGHMNIHFIISFLCLVG